MIALALGAMGSSWLGRARTGNASHVPSPSSGVGEDTPGERSDRPPRAAPNLAQPEAPAARAATVQGFVLGVDNLPVEGAVVETHPGGVQMAVTGSNGEFVLASSGHGAVVRGRKGGLQSAPAIASAAALDRSLILTLKEAGQLLEDVVPGEYKLCVTFSADGPEPVLPRCQPLSVAAGGKAQEVRL